MREYIALYALLCNVCIAFINEPLQLKVIPKYTYSSTLSERSSPNSKFAKFINLDFHLVKTVTFALDTFIDNCFKRTIAMSRICQLHHL